MHLPLYQQFCQQLKLLLPEPLPSCIAVAVSGGSDSMALLHLAKRFALEHNISLIAVTVDHQLRPESAQEAAEVHKFLEAQQVEHHTLVWDHPPITSNIQSQARTARYRLMAEFCHKHSCKHLLLAHHQDDQLEHYFLRQERNSGVIGMAPIASKRELNNLTIIRPLLSFTKADLLRYLQGNTWPYWEDPSNQQDCYRRNFWRQRIANLSEAERANILTQLAEYETQAQKLQEQVDKAFQELVEITPLGTAYVDLGHWKALPDDIKWRLTIDLAIYISGTVHKWRGSEVTRLAEHLSTASAKTTTFHGLIWGVQGNQIICYREPAAAPKGGYVIPPQSSLYFDQRWYIENNSQHELYISAGEVKTLAELTKLVPELSLYAKLNKVRARELLTLPLLRLEKCHYLPHISNVPAEIVVEFLPLHDWQ